MSSKGKEHKKPRGKKKAQGKSYVVSLTRENGEVGVILSKVASKGNKQKCKYPPCLENHIVKPLF